MDATEKSLGLFNDPGHWDLISSDVPIFIAHDAYEKISKDKDGNDFFAYEMVPIGGKPKGDGWKFKYRVDKDDLKEIAKEITRGWEEDWCPIKIFAGHTKPPKTAQKDQPPLIGYGAFGAEVKPWGPKGKPAVFLRKQFISKGYGELAAELPERSPEFFPNSNQIRAVALLKNDPRFNLGMTIYNRPDGVICYQRGIENMPATMDPTAMPPSAAEMRAKPDDGDLDADGDTDMDDVKKAEFMRYMKACYPDVHKQYAMAAASPTNGAMSGSPPVKPVAPAGDDKPVNFQQEIENIQYKRMQSQIDALKTKNDRKECEDLVRDLVQNHGVYLPNANKEVEKLMRYSTEERQERVEEIRLNYQRDPTAGKMVEVERAALDLGPKPTFDQIAAAVHYTEANNLDMDDNDDFAKAMEAVRRKTRR